MPTKNLSNVEKLQLKKEYLKQICTLLKEQEVGLEASQIAALLPNLKILAVKRYLEELWAAGHVSRRQAPNARKRAWAYHYLSDYGTKTDMVSLAIANPLHHLVTKIATRIGRPTSLNNLEEESL